jgi:hypothetical protein
MATEEEVEQARELIRKHRDQLVMMGTVGAKTAHHTRTVYGPHFATPEGAAHGTTEIIREALPALRSLRGELTALIEFLERLPRKPSVEA